MATIEERLAKLETAYIEASRRIATLEGQFEFVVGQLKNLQTYMHGRFEQIDRRFDAIDKRFDAVDKRFDKLETDVAGLRRDLPVIVADTMREVLREGKP